MKDIYSMVWKETKDFYLSGGLSNLLQPLILIFVLGIALPLSFSQDWLNLASAPVMTILFVPFMFISSFIGDAVAGERERHTLETLLASSISSNAILLGKLVVSVGFTWGLTLLSLLVAVISINLYQAQVPWKFYTSIDLFLIVIALSFLVILLAACGGVLISLKSTTVRQAAQLMVVSEILLVIVIYFAVRLIPQSVTNSLTSSQITLIVFLVLMVLDGILLAFSIASFRRSRLILG